MLAQNCTTWLFLTFKETSLQTKKKVEDSLKNAYLVPLPLELDTQPNAHVVINFQIAMYAEVRLTLNSLILYYAMSLELEEPFSYI